MLDVTPFIPPHNPTRDDLVYMSNIIGGDMNQTVCCARAYHTDVSHSMIGNAVAQMCLQKKKKMHKGRVITH